MNLLNLFKKRASAPVARDRLQILLAHERTMSGGSDLVLVLRKEILDVIARHLAIDPDNVHVSMQREDAISTLTVDVEIGSSEEMAMAGNM